MFSFFFFFFFSNDRIKEVQKDIDETKEIMEDNIDNMLKNIEKAEVVEEKTGNTIFCIFVILL